MNTPLPTATGSQTRQALWKALRSRPRDVAIIITLSALTTLGGLALPAILGLYVTMFTHGTATKTNITQLSIAAIAVTLIAAAISYAADRKTRRWGARLSETLRNDVANSALSLDMKTLENTPLGDLTARTANDTNTVSNAFSESVPIVLIGGTQIITFAAAFAIAAPILSPALILLVFPVALAMRWYARRASPAYATQTKADAAIADLTAETARGARTVETLRAETNRLAVVDNAVHNMWRSRTRTLWLRNILIGTIQSAPELTNVATLAAGGILVIKGHLALGALVAATGYLLRMQEPLLWMSEVLQSLQLSQAAMARVAGVTMAPAAAAPTQQLPADDNLKVTNMSYTYRPDLPYALTDLNLTINSGERLAIVGPSGAGKTTLGRLLAGFDSPTQGNVTIGGVPIADLPAHELSSRVFMATQDHHVFAGTLRDNLILAAKNATDDQLLAAMQTVGADLTAFPDGLNTVLGEGGIDTEGAAAQHIALARVVLANPHTVILDEATSMLSPADARTCEQGLAQALQGRTVIAIAHRLQTARDADRIAVVANGQIAELGSHDQLLALGKQYADLWHTWHGDDRSSEPASSGDDAISEVHSRACP